MDPLAESWIRRMSELDLPAPRADLEALLTAAVSTLTAAAATRPPDLDRARGAGASLVHAGITGGEALAATIIALSTHLVDALRTADVPEPETMAPELIAAVGDGYVRSLSNQYLLPLVAPAATDVGMLDALHLSEARFRAVFANAGVGIIIGDPFGRLVDANSCYAAMLGYRVEELRGRDVRELIHPDEAGSMMDTFRSMLRTGEEVRRFERRYLHRDGHVVLTELTASFVRRADGHPILSIIMVTDITERLELQRRLRHQALHDPLTDLPNRALVQERLGELFATTGGRAGLCFLDLDRFKVVNDRLGHEIGDALLVEVAARLNDTVSRRGHLVGRMGGDEFVIVVQNPRPGELAELAAAVLSMLEEPIEVAGHRLSVSASIGIVENDVATTTPAHLLKSADVTLYWAKSDGRARWAAFDIERNARDMTNLTVLATLAQGLERDEFRVEYQPIVDLADDRVIGVEALVRWDHPILGYLAPGQFIGPAEDTGAIVPLGRLVLTQACRDIARWNTEHPDRQLYVSVNLAARQAAEQDLVGTVADVLAATGLPAGALQLEVTESALLGPGSRSVEVIGALAATGVRVAVDDFGSGYSNLGYLPRLPLHTLKIAGILIDDLRDGPGDCTPIVANLIHLAHELGLHVTAEQVETRDQVRRLRDCGCDSAQGWYYAKPAPLAALGQLVGLPGTPGSTVV